MSTFSSRCPKCGTEYTHPSLKGTQFTHINFFCGSCGTNYVVSQPTKGKVMLIIIVGVIVLLLLGVLAGTVFS